MKMLSEKNKKFLLNLAKKSVNSYINKNKLKLVNKIPNNLKEKKPVFVSVYVNKQLRGCVGSILPRNEIYKEVINNSIKAAFNDFRFPSISKEDLKNLKIEISILTDPVKFNIIDYKHLLKKLNSKEGLVIKQGKRSATFLPQVWEKLKNKDDFLMHLCFKAGLNIEDWKDSKTEVYAYKVEKFST